jgi:hypothetical protein
VHVGQSNPFGVAEIGKLGYLARLKVAPSKGSHSLLEKIRLSQNLKNLSALMNSLIGQYPLLAGVAVPGPTSLTSDKRGTNPKSADIQSSVSS